MTLIICEASKTELAAACEVYKEILFNYAAVDSLDKKKWFTRYIIFYDYIIDKTFIN